MQSMFGCDTGMASSSIIAASYAVNSGRVNDVLKERMHYDSYRYLSGPPPCQSLARCAFNGLFGPILIVHAQGNAVAVPEAELR